MKKRERYPWLGLAIMLGLVVFSKKHPRLGKLAQFLLFWR